MAENNVETDPEWNEWALDSAEDTLMAMETLLATLRAFEDVLRQQEISTISSTEYCDNFCQALMHYAGSRNSMEHGLPLLEVYCLSINCFAAARSHLTAESDKVALVLKRLALSCLELLLSVPENEIPFEAWVQFHHSVQIAHDTLLQYGSTDLQALLQITGEGGAWSNTVLTALLTGQPTNQEEVDAYIDLEGEGFMEMRVKHLEKMGELAKAVVLAKACSECSLIPNQATFRQTYVSLLCHLLPNEEAIVEISKLDCKEVLDITCSLETDGEENTAFILCTTFLTQHLQQQSLDCSWELTLLWSKLQRRLDPSLTSLLERCLQLGAIAKTVQHLLYLVRVIQAEAKTMGIPASVELCVKALQLPKQDDSETRTSVCKTMSCLLSNDLEVLRACQLTEFLLGPCQEAFTCLEELYSRPDQKFDQENEVIPNSLRCELLLALKAYWPFDPEFWDWKTLKRHCISLQGLKPESEGEDEEQEVGDKQEELKPHETEVLVKEESKNQNGINGAFDPEPQVIKQSINIIVKGASETKRQTLCKICKRSVANSQMIHHSKRHARENSHPCPVCLEKFKSRKDLVSHLKKHIPSKFFVYQNNVKSEDAQKAINEEDDIEPGEIPVDPSLVQYYKSTHDPDVLHHIVEQAKTIKEKQASDNENITFDYMEHHFKLQNREEYPCPGTGCTRVFKHSKYLYVHLRSEHIGDSNVKYFHQMRDKREKCVFCRRHFVSAYHHLKHRRVHFGDRPYKCVVVGCGEEFSSSNELVAHKQTHGYQLNYQCELKGCYVTYSDLGQIYHHEAQHFRDAAFTCTSTGCRKFYFSKKDFVRHLSTHKITFTENDFEVQRRAKQKCFKTIDEPPMQQIRPAHSTNVSNGDVLNSAAVSCASSSQESNVKEPKSVMTLVAVCFDGSKFTCGFEKCGMTFSRARDVQRHLKCAHPEHLKLENREHKHDNEQAALSEMIIKPDSDSNKQANNEPSIPYSHSDTSKEKKGISHHKHKETSSPSHNPKSDSVKEIVFEMSKLSLNPSPHSLPSKSSLLKTDSKTSQNALHQAIMAKTPIVLLKSRPQLPEVKIEVKAEQVTAKSEKESDESLANPKPYICEVKECGFRTAHSFNLMRHYRSKHSYSAELAKERTSLKPFICQICSKPHREKLMLKDHYIRFHNIRLSLVDKTYCRLASFEEAKESSSSSKKTSGPRTNHRPKKRNQDPKLQCQDETKISKAINKNDHSSDNHSPSEDDGEDEAEKTIKANEQKGESEDTVTQQVRTRRLVAKNNMCYILDKFSKPFQCVAKYCPAAFSTQGGLVRHLQLVHHYNRSQLLLDKDGDVHPRLEVRRESAKRRLSRNSDEPQPQFKCNFANCGALYHLRSSLLRHTRDSHSHPSQLIRCKYDGCSRVFSHNNALKKHTVYSHCQYYDSLVVRLQSTHKKSINGCQKKLIVAPKNCQKDAEQASPKKQDGLASANSEVTVTVKSEENSDEGLQSKKETAENEESNHCFSRFLLRSHEEALQMCQDRGTRASYPCMVQDCDSVVRYVQSISRHYMNVHSMRREDLLENSKKLIFNAEQLEELIQRKSARPTVAGTCDPKEVRTGVQAESENITDQSTPTSEPSAKAETKNEDGVQTGLPQEKEKEPPTVVKSAFPVKAEAALNGEGSSDGHSKELSAAPQKPQKQEERLTLDKIRPFLRQVTVDLSPPCSLRFTTGEVFNSTSTNKDGGKMINVAATLPSPHVRQPLKRKNELPEQPTKLKDSESRSSSPRSFDIATYKPVGFESSFLNFIQDTTPKDKKISARWRDGHRRSCSVKENNQLGVSHSRSRRTHSSLVKLHPMCGNFTKIQNLKSILDKALAGCGDLAIKQLQYLRPVVVLGRPVCTTTLPHFFSSDSNSNKLLLGS